MNFNEFREKYNYAPFTISDIASMAAKLKDAKEVRQAAKQYLEAERRFEAVLEKNDFEIG